MSNNPLASIFNLYTSDITSTQATSTPAPTRMFSVYELLESSEYGNRFFLANHESKEVFEQEKANYAGVRVYHAVFDNYCDAVQLQKQLMFPRV